MDVKLTVVEVEGKDGFFNSSDDAYRAIASVLVDGKTLNGFGEHVDQTAAEALAVADLRAEYKIAFPPVKTVVIKTLSIDFE